MADAIKISDTSIEMDEVTPAVPEKVTRQKYDRKFIEEQILAITKQRDAEIADIVVLKEAELKKCTDIIKEMDKLGVAKATEPTEVVSG